MDLIRRYCMEELKCSQIKFERITEKIYRHEDIKSEFEHWINNRNYDAPNAVEIEGYTAAKLYGIASFLDGIGIFNFMVTLREDPDKAKELIAAGFPRK